MSPDHITAEQYAESQLSFIRNCTSEAAASLMLANVVKYAKAMGEVELYARLFPKKLKPSGVVIEFPKQGTA